MDTRHPVRLQACRLPLSHGSATAAESRHLCTWEDRGSATAGTSQSQETPTVGWGYRAAGCGDPGSLRLVPGVSKPPTWP